MMLGVLESAREVEVKEAEPARKLAFIFHFHNCQECLVSCRHIHHPKQRHYSMMGFGEVVKLEEPFDLRKELQGLLIV